MTRAIRSALREMSWDHDLATYLAVLPMRPGLWKFLRRRSDGGRPSYLGLASDAPHVSLRLSEPLLPWLGTSEKIHSCRVALASHSFDLLKDGGLPWTGPFEDYEDMAALHRFAWLLPEILRWSRSGEDAANAWGFFLRTARSWVEFHPFPTTSPAWHPYTISERLVNWTWASLALGKDLPSDPGILASIQLQAEHLRETLEYQGEGLTGNHLSNNGRALYLCGLICGNDAWTVEGRAILIHELTRLFQDGRFLREGSSHYQFLVTRNYCEALWAAKASGDHLAVEHLAPAVVRMAEGCRLFLVRQSSGEWGIPLIGDISPDCNPEWLLGVPWVAATLSGCAVPGEAAPAKGWHELFKNATGNAHAVSDKPMSSSEWARVDLSGWTLFAHVNPEGYPFCPGHAHQDTGAFVAYYRGSEVVIDAGRRTYCEDDIGKWGQSSGAHSLLRVDGLNPAPFWRRIYSQAVLQEMVGRRPTLEVRGDQISITHGGFSRKSGIGLHSRKIEILAAGEIVITDEVAGFGSHHIELILHFAGAIARNGDEVVIRGEGWNGQLILPSDISRISIKNAPHESDGFGWRSRCYGGKTPAGCLVWETETTLPWRGRTVLRVER